LPSENRLLAHPAALCNAVRRIALEAGALTLEYFDDAGFHGAAEKGDGSPVTEADHAAEALITKALTDLVPGVPVIAEEAAAKGTLPALAGAEYFWLVDPLDGTKEFISGGGDYTVNIALIHNDMPVLGVVYAPVPGTLYAGYGSGDAPGIALRYMDDSEKERPITVRVPPRSGLTVVASRHHHGNDKKMAAFLAGYKVEKLIKKASSLKICAVAAGKADLYPRFGPTCEWDTAAADAVLRAAGGIITDLSGTPLRYGRADQKFLNPEFVASGTALRLDDTSGL